MTTERLGRASLFVAGPLSPSVPMLLLLSLIASESCGGVFCVCMLYVPHRSAVALRRLCVGITASTVSFTTVMLRTFLGQRDPGGANGSLVIEHVAVALSCRRSTGVSMIGPSSHTHSYIRAHKQRTAPMNLIRALISVDSRCISAMH